MISQSALNNWLKSPSDLKKIPTMIPVAAVALVNSADHVLMQQRRFGRAHGGLWEFPGGKVEPAETLESALLREIREELGIALDPASLRPINFAASPDDPYVVLLYICRAWQGEPQCLDGEAIAWVPVSRLLERAMPPLDVPLARALQECLQR